MLMPRKKPKRKSRPSGLPRPFWRISNPQLAVLAAFFAVTGAIVVYRSLAATATVTTSTGVVTHGAIVSNSNTVGWLLVCDPSHTLPDDPIKFPGISGASHMHDFWGNASTAAASTYASMTNAANVAVADTYIGQTVHAGTSCDRGSFVPGTEGDTAAYWAPSVYVNGHRIVPATGSELYYRSKATPNRKDFVPFPNDARIIVGSHTATSEATNPALTNAYIYWECSGITTVHYLEPPNNCSGGEILVNIIYPSCWDGKPMDHTGPSGSDNPHFAYASPMEFGSCPAAFPRAIPQLSEKFKYNVGNNSANVIQLSADPGMNMGLMPTYTIHADFWNTWQPAALQYLVTNCINAGISCGTNPLTPIGGVPSLTPPPSPTPTPAPSATPSPTATPTPAPTPGDINGDGRVNVTDLSIMLSHWGTNYAPADLNHDGTVNVFDASILLAHWTG
jgi:hypothetical protein